MASPTVVGTPAETAVSTASTSHVVNLPAGATGNLLVAVMSKGSAGTTPSVNALAGWTELLDEAIVLGLYIAYRVADDTEGATTTFTLSSATRGAWIVYEVSGYANPATQASQVGTTATGSSTTPDPPSVSVTGGSKDILAIALFGRAGEEADDDTWVTAAPTSYTNLLQKACGVAGTNLAGMVATAERQVTTATENPATFTCATGAWRAQTIVIHPDATIFKTLGVCGETGAAQTLSKTQQAQSRTLTAATETGTAQVLAFELVSSDQQKTLTATAETDAAQALSKTQAAQPKTLGQALETDAAQTLSTTQQAQTAALTATGETGAAQVLSSSQTPQEAALSATAETDAAQALAFTQAAQTPTFTAAAETGTAEALSVTQAAQDVSLTAAGETDAAMPLSTGSDIHPSFSPTVETDAAVALGFTQGPAQSISISTSTGTDVAVALTYSQAPTDVVLTPASELDTATALSLQTPSFTLTAATSTNTAMPLDYVGGSGYAAATGGHLVLIEYVGIVTSRKGHIELPDTGVIS